MRIAFYDPGPRDYTIETLEREPVGGTESAMLYLAEALTGLGHEVAIINGTSRPGAYRRIEHVARMAGCRTDFLTSFDAVVMISAPIGERFRQLLPRAAAPRTRLIYWNSGTAALPVNRKLAEPGEAAAWDGQVCVSCWQADGVVDALGFDRARIAVLRNAIAPAFARLPLRRVEDRALAAPVFYYASTPFRGLDLLLEAWPAIQAKLPQAQLKLYSSMATYGLAHEDRSFAAILAAARRAPGVELVGGLAQPLLAQAAAQAQFLLYPSSFAETSCITAMEAMAAGALPIVAGLGALPETLAGYGRWIPPLSEEGLKEAPARARFAAAFAAATIQTVAGARADPAGFATEIAAMQGFARGAYDWNRIARHWIGWLQSLPVAGASGVA